MRYQIVPKESQVWVRGSSNLHPVRANATGLEGWIDADVTPAGVEGPLAGHIEIAVEALRSGNWLLERETRRRVDAKHHPLITGEVTGVQSAEGTALALTGVVDFRGESVEVEGDLEVTPTAGGGVHVEGEHVFDIRKWGLEPPSLLALRMHPDIHVRVSIQAEPG